MARLELKQSEAKPWYLISDAEKQKKHHAEKKALVMQFAGQNESNAAKYANSPTAPQVDCLLKTCISIFIKQLSS